MLEEEEAICLGVSEEKCVLDSVALGRSIQLKHSAKELSLRDSIRALVRVQNVNTWYDFDLSDRNSIIKKIEFVRTLIQGATDDTPQMDMDATITQMSLAGLKVEIHEPIHVYDRTQIWIFQSTFNAKVDDASVDDGFSIPAQYYGEGPYSLINDFIMSPANPCSGRATHLIFIESRAERSEIREMVRKYLLTDGAQQAGLGPHITRKVL